RRPAEPPTHPPPIPKTPRLTVARSAESKYVRATTLRFERGGELHGVGDRERGPSLFVLTADAQIRMTIASTVDEPGHKRAGSVWLFKPGMAFGLTNTGSTAVEIVRFLALERLLAPPFDTRSKLWHRDRTRRTESSARAASRTARRASCRPTSRCRARSRRTAGPRSAPTRCGSCRRPVHRRRSNE